MQTELGLLGVAVAEAQQKLLDAQTLLQENSEMAENTASSFQTQKEMCAEQEATYEQIAASRDETIAELQAVLNVFSSGRLN